jgi:hypothetical protein
MRLYDMDDQSLIHLALNEPDWMFQHAPELVWKHNQSWVVRYQRHWAAVNKAIHVLKTNPGWMCAACPSTVILLDIALMMQEYPSWVRDHRPDIFYTYEDRVLNKVPPPVWKREVEYSGITGWFLKIWDNWHMPKFNPKVKIPGIKGKQE